MEEMTEAEMQAAVIEMENELARDEFYWQDVEWYEAA
jgi:hypothetical protein